MISAIMHTYLLHVSICEYTAAIHERCVCGGVPGTDELVLDVRAEHDLRLANTTN